MDEKLNIGPETTLMHPDLCGLPADAFDDTMEMPDDPITELVASTPIAGPSNELNLGLLAGETAISLPGQAVHEEANFDHDVVVSYEEEEQPSPSWQNGQGDPPSPIDSVDSVSHANFDQERRTFGQNNRHWFNVESYNPEDRFFPIRGEILTVKRIEGRRVVYNYVIRGCIYDQHRFHRLVRVEPRSTERPFNPELFCFSDDTHVFSYAPCRPITVPDGFRWETFERMNDVGVLTIMLMD